ncbi:pantoate--beta-alanine ligase [gut metagenome]|uniref:Pantoate--beta-alanine ligase n=1 Tax=gut metagenome TaxID=749906 RepID=J9FR14_9ZZZZ
MIARVLKESVALAKGKSVSEVIKYVVDTINSDPVMDVEYYEIVDGNTLESINDWSETDYPVGCVTVYCGEVRLIDNIKY